MSVDWMAALAGLASGSRALGSSLKDIEDGQRQRQLDAAAASQNAGIMAMRQAAADRDAQNAPIERATQLGKLRQVGVVPGSEARPTDMDLGDVLQASGGFGAGLHGTPLHLATAAARYKPLEPGSGFVQDEWNSPSAQKGLLTRLLTDSREAIADTRAEASTNNNIRSTTTSSDNTDARVNGMRGVAAIRAAATQAARTDGSSQAAITARQRQAYIARRADQLMKGTRTFGGRYAGGVSHDDAFAQATADAERVYGAHSTTPSAVPSATAPVSAPVQSGDIDLRLPAKAQGSFSDKPPAAPVSPTPNVSDPVAIAAQRIRSGAVSLPQLEASGKSQAFKDAVKRQLGVH
jgi:hypothetical protein